MDLNLLARTLLFRGLDDSQLERVLAALYAQERSWDKDEVMLRAGEETTRMGLVLSGGVRIELDDAWGGKSILSQVGPGEMFGETYACLPGQTMLVSAVAAQPSRVLLLDPRPLLAPNPEDSALRQVTANLLRVSIRKNLVLSQRILHTCAKTIRGRLLSYLSEQALLAGRRQFTIPFNRQQLADYLGVDRSALSAELSRMRTDGLLTAHRSTFTLHSTVEW